MKYTPWPVSEHMQKRIDIKLMNEWFINLFLEPIDVAIKQCIQYQQCISNELEFL